jgi:hypothetical protein
MTAIDKTYMESTINKRLDAIWTAATTPNRTHIEVAFKQILGVLYGDDNTLLTQAQAALREEYIAL